MNLFLIFSLTASLVFSSVSEGNLNKNFTDLEEPELFEEPFIAISLGINCLPAVHLRSAKLHKKTFPFDVCYTSFDTLYSIIENDFEDFFNFEYLFSNNPGKSNIVKHQKYQFQIAHTFDTSHWFNSEKGLCPLDLQGEQEKQHLSEAYARRINRFKNVMNSGHPVFLFRLDLQNQIKNSEEMKLNSRNQAIKLQSLLKSKFPKSNFKLVFFYEKENKSSLDWEEIDGIIYFYPQDQKEILPPSFSKLFSNLITKSI